MTAEQLQSGIQLLGNMEAFYSVEMSFGKSPFAPLWGVTLLTLFEFKRTMNPKIIIHIFPLAYYAIYISGITWLLRLIGKLCLSSFM